MATRLKPDWALAYNEMGMRFAYHQSRGQLPQSAALLSLAVRLDPRLGHLRGEPQGGGAHAGVDEHGRGQLR